MVKIKFDDIVKSFKLQNKFLTVEIFLKLNTKGIELKELIILVSLKNPLKFKFSGIFQRIKFLWIHLKQTYDKISQKIYKLKVYKSFK